MNHPELLAVPVLMLADYVLTILGARSSEAVYSKHFTTPSYELNPLWRKSIDRNRWFDARHIALVALVTVGLIWLGDWSDRRSATALLFNPFELTLGALIGALSSVCGRHLGNVMIFRYMNRRPNEISGQVRMSMTLTLKISQFNYISWIPLLFIVVILAPNSYTFGVLFGLLVKVGAHFAWARKAQSTEAKLKQAIEQEEQFETEA